ncbi:MAG TPA: ATP-binding protein [Gemmatimonadales bacterium]|nr:ATP-binding protein [Gemmatimonadales bacterium]
MFPAVPPASPTPRPLSLQRLRLVATEHHSRWVRVSILMGTAGYGVSFVIGWFTGAEHFPYLFTDLGAFLACAIALLLFQLGWVVPAIALTLVAVSAEMNLSLVLTPNSGQWISLPAFPLLVAGAGLLLGGRIGLIAAGVMGVAGPLAIAGNRWVHGAHVTGTDVFTMTVLDLAIVAMAILIALFLDSFNAVLLQSRENERRFADLFRAAPDGVISVDAAGRVEAMNPAAAALLNSDVKQVAGRSLGDILREAVGSESGSLAARLERGEDSSFPVTLHPRPGRIVSCDVTARRTVRTDGSIGTMVVLRDVTARRAAEAEQRRLQQQLQESQKMEAVGRLAGGVAHDFNNLLTVIGGGAQFMKRITMDSEVLTLAEEIMGAQQRGAALTRHLLAFARREVAQPRPINLGEVVADLEPLMRKLTGAALTLRVEIRDPGMIVADTGQVEQVLLNLVANARDATPDGGVVTLEVVAGESGTTGAVGVPFGQVALRVRDTGTGMDEQTRSRIFEPFFTTKPRDKGTGLGLSTVHGIVSQAGGRIEVDTAPGRGTTFTVLWPTARTEGERPSAAAAAGGLKETRQPTGTGRILLVEDDEMTRRAIRRHLEAGGYEVIETPDGATALQVLEAGRVAVDFLLSDVAMPGVNGVELVRRVRTAGIDLPVLLMSGYMDDPVLKNLPPDAGFEILAKPFALDDLLTKVQERMGAAPSRAAGASTG